MNKEQIKSKMQSIEESIKEQTNELNKLRAEMDKPEKPTIEEMGRRANWLITHMGNIHNYNDDDYNKNCYFSRERAEKEKLRIKLSVIADYFNGGLFEGDNGYELMVNNRTGQVTAEGTGYHSWGTIKFKTREHAELAMTYFTEEELRKMLR